MDGHVARISVAPVKSLGLVHPDEIQLERYGVRGNRRLWIVDDAGRLFSNKRYGPMMRIRPTWNDETKELALDFPDGRRVEGVVELAERVDAQMHSRRHPSYRVVGPWAEAISSFVGRPLTLLYADEHAVDRGDRGGSVSLVSRASLERLAAEGGADGAVDGRRFRMLFEIDGVEAHAEDEWLGTPVRIGEATVVLNGDVGRCAVTTQNPDTGVPDFDTLGTLAAYRREGRREPLPFGVYGSVAVPGRVRIGDPVEPLQRSLVDAAP
ncbi:MAG TPA: MOSC N-terminal beta barrel domain-containing protein [Gaiellaceae bacterium]|nr:MOSC N-terminal beta barrel domain-containing protein [Gaiellaceae bacterium]